ncbi:MAG: nucleoside triphosphate pyrophosphohydrolase family protein [Bacteroidaceae bacterium]|nr:nucleoside triphosphate pyrophosphohydrolase family protein [Bacteroidaceae bacterium]
MHFNEYRALAQRTSNGSLTVEQHVINGALGLCGESGEVADLVCMNPTVEQKASVVEELGDVLWYCAELATWLELEPGIPMEGEEWGRVHGALGLCVAAASIADHVKKAYMQGHSVNKIKIASRVYTVFRIVSELAASVDSTASNVMGYNINKLRKRYPVKFDPDLSINREA